MDLKQKTVELLHLQISVDVACYFLNPALIKSETECKLIATFKHLQIAALP